MLKMLVTDTFDIYIYQFFYNFAPQKRIYNIY